MRRVTPSARWSSGRMKSARPASTRARKTWESRRPGAAKESRVALAKARAVGDGSRDSSKADDPGSRPGRQRSIVVQHRALAGAGRIESELRLHAPGVARRG